MLCSQFSRSEENCSFAGARRGAPAGRSEFLYSEVQCVPVADGGVSANYVYVVQAQLVLWRKD